MERLRLATEAEVEEIKSTSDLDPTCAVLALTTAAGVAKCVVRMVVEVDPVYFPEGFPDRLKAVFLRDVETYLSAKGVPKYYFNILESDLQWQEVAETWGAKKVSTAPEVRFKKDL